MFSMNIPQEEIVAHPSTPRVRFMTTCNFSIVGLVFFFFFFFWFVFFVFWFFFVVVCLLLDLEHWTTKVQSNLHLPVAARLCTGPQ